ncbi:hypothetical protein F5884DRAFT_35823 [Xylogone sp. PMI_703]|nr:hypothetical protein F5884DRAFT_35823 [Xylogone sp. PMI_703]
MPSDDYTLVVRGGLKLKGAAKPAGITKKKKKKKEGKDGDAQSTAIQKALEDEDASSSSKPAGAEGDLSDAALAELEERGDDGKTAAERAHEEMRRKRLEDRLKKEGVKTHKERVEELNKYLSNLSEHHDMPRIGPG